MRNILFFVLASLLLNASVASADFYLKIHDTSAAIPATGSTTVSVPISLEITGGVPSNLLLDFYELAFDISLPSGVVFSPNPPSDAVGATSLLTNFPVDTNATVSFASIAVGSNSVSIPTVPNITTASTPLFSLDFEVSASAIPQMVAITIPMNAAHTALNYPLFNFIDDPSTAGMNEAMALEMVALSADSGKLTLTAVPEPSELILGFLMCGLTGVVMSKKYFNRSSRSKDADDAA